MIPDKYTKKYLDKIKKAKSNEEIIDIINRIYTEGFDDGEQTHIKPLKTK